MTLRLQSGYEMPLIGLGTWKSAKGQVQSAVECAIESGYRHIDCAWIYDNEDEVGMGITKMIKENKVKREELFITTKLFNIFHHPDMVRPGLIKSLKKLNLDYLDLYLMHSPCGEKYISDEDKFPKGPDGSPLYDDTDYVQTWKEMEKLQKEGLVRSIGISNFNEYQINRILNECSIPPSVNQVEVNPYFIQKDLVSYCNSKGIVVTAYSPFGSPDRPWAKPGDPLLLEDPGLVAIAKRLNKTVAQVILRYLIQRKLIVIPKSVTPERIKSNLAVFDFELTQQDMDAVSSFNRDFRVCNGARFSGHKYFPFQENYSE
ncbi:aldo-keto reductase family 1 member B1-like [Clavelina lepadiformis]|uniref:aldo-keto reductase family 1 member B1-like n=1 Tax=Clavelina lepadiformis TaxID=159417 RepID=UPI0040410A74